MKPSRDLIGITDAMSKFTKEFAQPVGITAELSKLAGSAFANNTMSKFAEGFAHPAGTTAEPSKLAGSAFASDALGKLTRDLSHPVGISAEMSKLAGSAFASDSMSKLTRDLARPIGIGDAMSKFPGGLAHTDITAELRKLAECTVTSDAMSKFVAPPIGIEGELRNSLEHTARLARNVDQSLSNMALPAWQQEVLNRPLIPATEPNPVWQTNSQLSELKDTVTQLVDVARQQAELSQAIRTSADLALKYAVQSGEDAKAATLLARKSVRLTLIAIGVAIIVAIAGIAVNFNLSNSADARLKEEIRVLGDISGKLQQLNDRPVVNPAITPKPEANPNEPSQPPSAR